MRAARSRPKGLDAGRVSQELNPANRPANAQFGNPWASLASKGQSGSPAPPHDAGNAKSESCGKGTRDEGRPTAWYLSLCR